MREFGGHSTFAVGLRVDEDGDLRYAMGDCVIEICLTADDDPVSLREVRIAGVEETGLVPWRASAPE